MEYSAGPFASKYHGVALALDLHGGLEVFAVGNDEKLYDSAGGFIASPTQSSFVTSWDDARNLARLAECDGW